MMADEPLAAGPGVRPVAPILPRGAPASWLGRGYEGEEVHIAVSDSAGTMVFDSAVTIPAGGRFTTGVLPPGRYEHTVVTPAPDTTASAFEVESWTDEMLRMPVSPAELTVPVPAGSAALQRSRPLRTWPVAYLVILAALCAEWIGRRRAGLR